MPIDVECCHKSPHADHQGEKLEDIILGSNKNLKSPSLVSQRTDKGAVLMALPPTQISWDFAYKRDTKNSKIYLNPRDTECLLNNPLVSIIGSNKTIDSPSVVLGKRKRTYQGDGAVKLNEYKLELKKAVKCNNYTQLPKLLQYKNDSKSKSSSGAAASKIIPWELHLMIQKALKLRELLKLNKINREVKKALKGKNYTQLTKNLEYMNNSESDSASEDKDDSESESDNCHEFELEQCEDTVRFLVKTFKGLNQLSCDWEYDPDTASTFVAAKTDQSALPKTPPPQKKCLGCCSSVIDPNQKFPKTRNVPLNEEEKKLWVDFKDFVKDNLGLRSICMKAVDQHKRPLLLDNPIVSLTSKFSVTAFNEAIEMYIKKGENNNIHDIKVVECKYLKAIGWGYFFYITIEAFEEEKLGVYDTEVELNWDDGSKSLSCFVLTDRKPKAVRETTKRKTLPDSWQDVSGIEHSGMKPRLGKQSIICRGYDYLNPWGDDAP